MSTVSILINSYNYAAYLDSAIASAVAQTDRVGEIIVVDDGSTDGSPEIAQAWHSRDPRVRLITKANGGQLSALNLGFEASHGELLFFLDADDEFKSGYVEQMWRAYEEFSDADFAFCRWELLDGRSHTFRQDENGPGRCLGPTFWRTLLTREGIGGPTSSLSMRRSLAQRILPYPLEANWRTRADDVLVYGASLLGGIKLHVAQTGVGYRVHGQNLWHGKEESKADKARYEHSRDLLFGHLLKPMGSWCTTKMRVDGLPRLLTREFRLQPCPSREDLRVYVRLLLRHPGPRRLAGLWKVIQHFQRTRPNRKQIAPSTVGSVAET